MEESVRIRSAPNITLVAQLRRPSAEKARRAGILLLHPHPKLGGANNNPVIIALSDHLSRAGFTTLALNTRGVGGSEGWSSWRGAGEVEDARAAVKFLGKVESVDRIYVVGYSFGACVGGAVAEEEKNVRAWAAVSYPAGWLSGLLLGGLLERMKVGRGEASKLWVMGTHDQFTSTEKFEAVFRSLKGPKESALITGADHFWMRGVYELVDCLVDWFEKIDRTTDLPPGDTAPSVGANGRSGAAQ